MEQDERTVVDPSEGDTEKGREAPATALAGELAGADEGEQERASEADNSVNGKAALEGAKKQVLEQPSPESGEGAGASGSVDSEVLEAFEDTIATHFEFRASAVDAKPASTSLRVRSRGGTQAGPTKFVSAGDAEGAGSEDPVLGASSASAPAPATGVHEDVPAMEDGDRGAAPGDDTKLKRACSAPGDTVAIAHASPPDSYRRIPWRSRKQYSPKRFVAVVGASPSAAATPAGDPPAPAASRGSTLPSASVSGHRTESSGVIDASSSSSSSNRPPSRGRKQPRPEHFIPEEAEATASAKARRSDIVLDRFLSSLVHGSPASDSEWARNVTGKDAAVRGEHDVEGFRIRDASRHATRARGLRAAISRLGASCGGECASSSSSPGKPDGKGRFYGVLAVLGASLALSVVSCVLFYIVGQRSEPGPLGEKPDE